MQHANVDGLNKTCATAKLSSWSKLLLIFAITINYINFLEVNRLVSLPGTYINPPEGGFQFPAIVYNNYKDISIQLYWNLIP